MDMVGRQNEQQTFAVPGVSLEKQQIAGMPESDHLEKLTELLEQEQFELIDIPTGFTGHTEDRTLRLIYLMNDAVESFLVLKEARLGGLYKKDYEGSLTYSLDREEGEYVWVELAAIHPKWWHYYSIFSNKIARPADTEYLFICNRRINNVYDLKIENRGETV